MNYRIKAALLGGDMRQSAAARFLSESGIECAVWGLDPTSDIGGAVRCDERCCGGHTAAARLF